VKKYFKVYLHQTYKEHLLISQSYPNLMMNESLHLIISNYQETGIIKEKTIVSINKISTPIF
jgi:hypothetical protein